MKNLLLVAIGIMFSLQMVADPMVRGGALGSRVSNSADELLIHGGVTVGNWAGKKIGGWVDDSSRAVFGVDGKTVVDRVLTAVLVATIAAGAYKAGQYVLNRESNANKVKRAMLLWTHMNEKLKHMRTKGDFQSFIYNFKNLEQAVLDSYMSLDNRYCSWVKPWNWTSEMKEAYEKMKIASAIFDYQDILTMHEYNEADVLHVAIADQSMVTAYPICAYVEKLQADIAVIKNINSYQISAVLLCELNKALQVIAGSMNYVEERRALQDAIARERLVGAIDRRF